MLDVSRNDVQSKPFPHVVKEGILPQELYAGLRADYPTAALFEDQHGRSGSVGSRTGAGTGFDIYRGDAEYDRLLSRSASWAEFDQYINSPAFVSKFLELFGPDLTSLACSVDVDADDYDPSLIEGRDVLRDKVTLGERLRGLVESVGSKTPTRSKLFTRLDIEKSLKGYAKPPHCDRGNRLASLIIYFTDAQQVGLRGGELNIYEHKQKKPPRSYERHPNPNDVKTVATLTPQQNLGVFFPCCNNSYHGVNAVETTGIARDFLYINISADKGSCWF